MQARGEDVSERPGDQSGDDGRGVTVAETARGARRVLARYPLLPLRVFLGATFVYAGLDKLSDPNFLHRHGSGSMLAQLIAVSESSPISFLVNWLAEVPTATGLLFAFGQIAVGLGTLFGLFARIAAIGGGLISLGLWLTVTWDASPYYLGNDLAYLMAWIPLALCGAPYYSVDSWRAERARGTARVSGAAAARRRLLVDGGLAAGAVAVLGVVSGTLANRLAGGGKSEPSAPTRPPTPSRSGGSPTASPSAPPIGQGGGPTVPLVKVPVGGAARVEDPSSGDPVYVVQPKEGRFEAFSGVCTHKGCEVRPPKKGKFHCPCHGSVFDAETGEAVEGPARKPLAKFPVRRHGKRLKVEL